MDYPCRLSQISALLLLSSLFALGSAFAVIMTSISRGRPWTTLCMCSILFQKWGAVSHLAKWCWLGPPLLGSTLLNISWETSSLVALGLGVWLLWIFGVEFVMVPVWLMTRSFPLLGWWLFEGELFSRSLLPPVLSWKGKWVLHISSWFLKGTFF